MASSTWPPSGVSPRRPRSGNDESAELVGNQVRQPQEGDAAPGQLGHPLDPALDGVPTLDAQDAGELSLALGAGERRRGGRQDRGTGRAHLGQPLDLEQRPGPRAPDCGERPAAREGEGLEPADEREPARDDGEDLEPDACLGEPDEVHVAPRAAAPGGRGSRAARRRARRPRRRRGGAPAPALRRRGRRAHRAPVGQEVDQFLEAPGLITSTLSRENLCRHPALDSTPWIPGRHRCG